LGCDGPATPKPHGCEGFVPVEVGRPALDSQAFGRLYSSPLSLQRFEVDAGVTNRSNYRLEGHATFGVERATAGVRII
jgi:hypothetical protein